MKSQWNNLRPFEKRVVVVVAAALFVVLNLWFVFPHFSDWGRVQQRMKNARKTLDMFQKALAQEPVFKARIKQLESEGLAVPAEDQDIHFSTTILDLAGRNHVNVTATGRVTTKTNDQFFVEKSQTITTQSGEQELVDFLYDLGKGNSLIRVRDLGLHPDPPRQQLSANIKLVASYQRKPPAKPAASAPQPSGAPATPAAPAKSGATKTNPPAAKAGATNPPAKTPIPTTKQMTPTNKPGSIPAKKP